METLAVNIWWVVSGAAFVVYPGVLVANVMSLAAKPDKSVSRTSAKYWFKVFPFRAMLIITTLFPVIYFLCLHFSRQALAEGHTLDAFLWMTPGTVISAGLFWFLLRR